jgi:hypothetical protein
MKKEKKLDHATIFQVDQSIFTRVCEDLQPNLDSAGRSHNNAAPWAASCSSAAAYTSSHTSAAFFFVSMHHLRLAGTPSSTTRTSATHTCLFVQHHPISPFAL